MKKRLLAVLLVCMLLFQMLPAAAMAAELSGGVAADARADGPAGEDRGRGGARALGRDGDGLAPVPRCGLDSQPQKD